MLNYIPLRTVKYKSKSELRAERPDTLEPNGNSRQLGNETDSQYSIFLMISFLCCTSSWLISKATNIISACSSIVRYLFNSPFQRFFNSSAAIDSTSKRKWWQKMRINNFKWLIATHLTEFCCCCRSFFVEKQSNFATRLGRAGKAVLKNPGHLGKCCKSLGA